ncbi:Type III secretion bridge between inner and outermembrane lipoprotein (YscJ,HrcJ,EscJ, PscJ) (plasmid) [Sinorhizobium sojae CCBAU 05684]|uniref:Lipoprotein n=1 Tax=Sinorhizobium sojae CCBAU 05684 TaxID=716928 RepID=A0A249PIG9_9HYPH|nr:type III secretion inner membrane ring lipoprotein SctJ [Sinorhizobium sojae]ASY65730.1 Type III secretion bridge between inner and outermembrane lipoprotein (YscJ,HrcJ,EscJ, PscJ) [Sinorhizobium sojae CCBAU 05684]
MLVLPYPRSLLSWRRVASGCCILLLAIILSACSKDVLTGLDQRDVLDAQVLLERAGIPATVSSEKGGAFTLSVDAQDHARALELLADAGLPRSPRSTVAELFPGEGFLVTPFEQKARMTFALEQQLGETLSALEGVALARVHVVMPEDNGRGLIKERARASALLQYRPGADVAEIEMKSRSLLLNSIRGLAYEDVSVVVSPWAKIGVTVAAEKAPEEVVPTPAAGGIAWLLDYRKLSIAGAVLLAIAATLILLPRRKES